MTLRRELIVSAGVLVVLNLCLAFGATALLGRMGPAIGRLLQANDYSNVAAENLLGEFARAGGQPFNEASRARARGSFEQIRGNVTESDERPWVAVIDARIEAAMAGDAGAIDHVARALGEISAVNRRAMATADTETQRLGSAGAWAVVGLGMASLWASLVIFARLKRRVLSPIVDLHEVLTLSRKGDRFRRCRKSDSAFEIGQVTGSVNTFLDERDELSFFADGRGGSSAALSALLTQIAESHPEPVVFVQRDGTKAAMNAQAHAILAEDEGVALAETFAELAATGTIDSAIAVAQPLGGAGWLCRLVGSPEAPDPGSAEEPDGDSPET